MVLIIDTLLVVCVSPNGGCYSVRSPFASTRAVPRKPHACGVKFFFQGRNHFFIKKDFVGRVRAICEFLGATLCPSGRKQDARTAGQSELFPKAAAFPYAGVVRGVGGTGERKATYCYTKHHAKHHVENPYSGSNSRPMRAHWPTYMQNTGQGCLPQ